MTYTKTFITVAILLITGALTFFAGQTERISPNTPFSEFPLEIEEWKGFPGKLDDKVYNILGVEDYILADYRKPSGEAVNLYVGFYQSQKEGDIIHSPKNCMPGAGWNIMETGSETIPLDINGKSMKVIKLTLRKGPEKQIALYWFQSRGRIISSEYMEKVWLVIDSITRHRTDGSFVRLITPVKKDEITSINLLKEFAQKAYPYLNEHIPN
ncbi:MAG: EpsI family protein [Desulfobacterales bacterium RIFOXYA12_FULL_46_15]|nr:MAG: EpsI family protein [Desulfobacula sp. GWF2_41_7]OGR28056.1 MAG: EpsI family protein [Desulfobacterales bacterium RIFOXYA12_FULL_46_15]